MKEIIAIIRPKMMGATKKALEELGYPGITAIPVLGRGKQRGIASEVEVEIRPKLLETSHSSGMKYIPKRQIMIVVPDKVVDTIAQTIIRINRTGQYGDGKIFVSTVDDALRIRTDEAHLEAIL